MRACVRVCVCVNIIVSVCNRSIIDNIKSIRSLRSSLKRHNSAFIPSLLASQKMFSKSIPSLQSTNRTHRKHELALKQGERIRITRKIAPDGRGCAETADAEMKLGRPIYTQMQRKLTEHLSPKHLLIIDESWQHAGHTGNPSGDASAETHFKIEIVSEFFEGLTQVKRQREVYKLLEQEFNEMGLHALQMKTRTPEEQAKLSN